MIDEHLNLVLQMINELINYTKRQVDVNVYDSFTQKTRIWERQRSGGGAFRYDIKTVGT